MRNEKGFTLIEMLIVLLIISILILVTIPNVMKHFATVDKKGCDAYIKMVQSQVEAFKIDHNKYPTMEELKAGKYLTEDDIKCPDNTPIVIEGSGEVKKASSSSTVSERNG